MNDTPEPIGGCQCKWQAAKLEPTETAMEPELKPCPFCGGDAGTFYSGREAACLNEQCAGWKLNCCSTDEWNTRATRATTLADALAVPEVAAMVEAAMQASAALVGPSDQYEACQEALDALRAALAAMEGRK